jgi:hypothetical protein
VGSRRSGGRICCALCIAFWALAQDLQLPEEVTGEDNLIYPMAQVVQTLQKKGFVIISV